MRHRLIFCVREEEKSLSGIIVATLGESRSSCFQCGARVVCSGLPARPLLATMMYYSLSVMVREREGQGERGREICNEVCYGYAKVEAGGRKKERDRRTEMYYYYMLCMGNDEAEARER